MSMQIKGQSINWVKDEVTNLGQCPEPADGCVGRERIGTVWAEVGEFLKQTRPTDQKVNQVVSAHFRAICNLLGGIYCCLHQIQEFGCGVEAGKNSFTQFMGTDELGDSEALCIAWGSIGMELSYMPLYGDPQPRSQKISTLESFELNRMQLSDKVNKLYSLFTKIFYGMSVSRQVEGQKRYRELMRNRLTFNLSEKVRGAPQMGIWGNYRPKYISVAMSLDEIRARLSLVTHPSVTLDDCEQAPFRGVSAEEVQGDSALCHLLYEVSEHISYYAINELCGGSKEAKPLAEELKRRYPHEEVDRSKAE